MQNTLINHLTKVTYYKLSQIPALAGSGHSQTLDSDIIEAEKKNIPELCVVFYCQQIF